MCDRAARMRPRRVARSYPRAQHQPLFNLKLIFETFCCIPLSCAESVHPGPLLLQSRVTSTSAVAPPPVLPPLPHEHRNSSSSSLRQRWPASYASSITTPALMVCAPPSRRTLHSRTSLTLVPVFLCASFRAYFPRYQVCSALGV